MNKNQEQRDYTPEELHREREYGVFWYSWLWTLLRPLLIALCVIVVVTGVLMGGWNWVNSHFLAPMDAGDESEITFVVSSGSSLTRVANNLEEAGLIHNRTVFKYVADFLGYGQKIQAGEYKVNSVPCLVLMKNGQFVDQSIGFKPEPLIKSWIEGNL